MVRIPNCPDMSSARTKFNNARIDLTEAREKYIQACWSACRDLNGRKLQEAVATIAERMQSHGLYAERTHFGKLVLSILKHFTKLDGATMEELMVEHKFKVHWLEAA